MRSDGDDARSTRSSRRRLVASGVCVTMAGGTLLATGYVASPPPIVAILGIILFLAGILMVGIGAGLRAAWSAFWQLFP